MSRIDVSRIPKPVSPEWLDEPESPACFKAGHFHADTTKWRDRRRYYLADIAHLDHQLGVVIDALKRHGRWANTYLIFVADHGDLLFDHGFFGKAERHYDACVRVPVIIAGPGMRKGLTCDAIVQLEDICPTVLDMTGPSLPEIPVMGALSNKGPADVLPGRSLLGWCFGERPQDWREAVYIESYNNINSYSHQNWARTIRTRDWRYTLYPQGSGEQLFCLGDDPDETANLARDGAYAQVRREMRDRLLEAVILQDYPHTRRALFSLGVY